MSTFNIETAIKNIQSDVDWFSLREYKENTDYRQARNGSVAMNLNLENHGLMVEVMHDGQLAYAGTSDLSKEGIQRAFDQAKKMSIHMKKYGIHSFDSSIRPDEKGSFQSHYETSLEELSPAEIQKRMIELSNLLKKDDRIIEASAMAMLIQTNIRFVSSSGASWTQDFSMLSHNMEATAKDHHDVQRRSTGMPVRQCGAESLELDSLKKEAFRIQQEAIELLSAENCPSVDMDLIIEPDQLYLQVHESIGHPLELDRILGDERNYAGWSFINPKDFGSLKYGPSILNVTFDPTLEGELASYCFDDNGVRAKKEYLIKDGVLERGIGGIESQKRSGIAGVSCARSSSWNRPPMDRMGNINIEPGNSSMEEMIRSTEKGVIMQTNRSWSIDDYRNKFQFGCERGLLIENGEIKKVVKNPNYRGSTVEFWNRLSHVGNQDTFKIWGSPYCGKGEPNQVIRVGHAVPTCKFEKVEVFGGAS